MDETRREKAELSHLEEDINRNQPEESIEQTSRRANYEEHELTPMKAIRKNPWVMIWCIYAIWMLILNSFENQAGGSVLGIPRFRKASPVTRHI